MHPKNRIDRLKLLLCFLLCSGVPPCIAASQRKSNIQLKHKIFPDQASSFKIQDSPKSITHKENDDTRTLVRKYRESPNISILEIGSNDRQDTPTKRSSIIPTLRVGRSGKFDENSIFPYPDSWIVPYLKNNKDNDKDTEDSIFYDSSVDEEIINSEEDTSSNNDNFNIFDENKNEESAESMLSENSLNSFEIMYDDESKSVSERQIGENGTMIAYPRFGKRNNAVSGVTGIRNKRTSESLIPQIRYGRSVAENSPSKIQKQPFYILPNYRPGRSLNSPPKLLNNEKLSNHGMLPYPRPGRSDTTIGSTNYMLPLPRFGRSVTNSMKTFETMDTDFPKDLQEELLKSEESKIFLIPYPRPGKRFFGTKPLPPNVKLESKGKEFSIQDSKEEKDPNLTVFVVPYPRPGRSNTKRKDFVVPNVRFGRSALNSMVPYPRLGRSNKAGGRYYILPYPRSGRSSSNVSLVPNARFGRSGNNMLPHFRFGKSYGSILPNPRFGRSEMTSRSIIPQIRVGKSADYEIIQQNGDSSDVQNNPYQGTYPKTETDKFIDAEDILRFQSEKLKSALLVPTKKLHKHMLMHDSNYMLPYPRPGRYV